MSYFGNLNTLTLMYATTMLSAFEALVSNIFSFERTWHAKVLIRSTFVGIVGFHISNVKSL